LKLKIGLRDTMDLSLPKTLKDKVSAWRASNYTSEYSAIGEILNYAYDQNFLRKAQFEALELYWYLRIVQKTPKISELYSKLFSGDDVLLLKAIGISLSQDDLVRLLPSGGVPRIFDAIKSDDDFVKERHLEVVKESLSLEYPSYIFALAMGSGKTFLIGAIIATEFAMSAEYLDNFVKNALVFAPGKTILGALKQISDTPFERILPPRLYKQFISSVKITYTQDGKKTIPVRDESSFNIIVTNTEKIRIQKRTKTNAQRNLPSYELEVKDKEEEEIANLRLQTIASLPRLAIFSDEAHHTYGKQLGKDLKKVRKTVNYLNENKNLAVVVNTTGTPYYNKEMLRDVVYWYGLSQGIQDGILKEVKDSIYSYEDISSENFVETVIEDFFNTYKTVELYNGAKSKIAIYFPQTEDLRKLKPAVEMKVVELGLDPSIIQEVYNESDKQTKNLFNNEVNDPQNPYRVYLLVNMGTEGWNCPSLFATALARKLKTSNNFVLQAASRCLRQVPNNSMKARIYLSKDNYGVLNSQLKETFGESLHILLTQQHELEEAKLILRKFEIRPLVLKTKMQKIIKVDAEKPDEIKLVRPENRKNVATKTIYDVTEMAGVKKALVASRIETIQLSETFLDIYEAAVDLAKIYRLEPSTILSSLRQIYPEGEIEASDLPSLKKQIEDQRRNYMIVEDEAEISLKIVKPEGFDKEEIDGKVVFTTIIKYRKSKADLLMKYEQMQEINKRELSFHYSPYNMDSNPEKDFFTKLLIALDQNPDDVKDIYFTGAITDSKKTDFLFEYKNKNGKPSTYTPDFIIIKNNGQVLIVEIKGEPYLEGARQKIEALINLTKLNPKLGYLVLQTTAEEVDPVYFEQVRKWIYGGTR
jgi:type III restriction enzyme